MLPIANLLKMCLPFAVSAVLCLPASAQMVFESTHDPVTSPPVRVLPSGLRVATMGMGEPGRVWLDGRLAALAPGATIRDEMNRLVLPAALQASRAGNTLDVAVDVDLSGQVLRIWLLTREEVSTLRGQAPGRR